MEVGGALRLLCLRYSRALWETKGIEIQSISHSFEGVNLRAKRSVGEPAEGSLTITIKTIAFTNRGLWQYGLRQPGRQLAPSERRLPAPGTSTFAGAGRRPVALPHAAGP